MTLQGRSFTGLPWPSRRLHVRRMPRGAIAQNAYGKMIRETRIFKNQMARGEAESLSPRFFARYQPSRTCNQDNPAARNSALRSASGRAP